MFAPKPQNHCQPTSRQSSHDSALIALRGSSSLPGQHASRLPLDALPTSISAHHSISTCVSRPLFPTPPFTAQSALFSCSPGAQVESSWVDSTTNMTIPQSGGGGVGKWDQFAANEKCGDVLCYAACALLLSLPFRTFDIWQYVELMCELTHFQIPYGGDFGHRSRQSP